MAHKIFDRFSPFANLDPLWRSYLAEEMSGKKEIEQILELLTERALQESYAKDQIVLKPPKKEESLGEFLLGDVYYGNYRFYPFGLRERELNSHIGIFGMTGAGKSSLVLLLLRNLHFHDIPFLVFDWKHEYGGLASVISNLKIFHAGGSTPSFFWNPLIPPFAFGVAEYQNYLKDIASLLVTSYFHKIALFSLEGMKMLFMETLDKLCEKLGTYKASQRYPTLHQVLLALEKPAGSLAYAYVALKSCLTAICFGSSHKIFNAATSVSLAQILATPVILELQSCGSESDKRFLTNAIIYWIYQYRLRQERTKQTRHALILEEAHHYQGELVEQMFRMVRAFGESLVFIDQHPALLSVPVFGNMYATISLNLKHEKDVELVAKTMGLDATQIQYLGKLAPGQAIVKLQGRYYPPFLIHFPFAPMPEAHKDEQPEEDNRDKLAPLSFPEDELKFLVQVQQSPALTTVERYKALAVNPRKGNALQKSLLAPAKK